MRENSETEDNSSVGVAKVGVFQVKFLIHSLIPDDLPRGLSTKNVFFFTRLEDLDPSCVARFPAAQFWRTKPVSLSLELEPRES